MHRWLSAASEKGLQERAIGQAALRHPAGRVRRAEALCKALNRFADGRSGVAAAEFALLMPLMLVIFSALVNLGFVIQGKIQINTALSAAGYYAFETGHGVTSSDAAGFSDQIKALVAAQLTGRGTFSTTVRFNGSTDTSAMDSYYCTSSASPPTFTASGSTQSTCSQDLTSGKYVTIEVVGEIAAPAPFSSFLGSILKVSETTHVRVL